MLRRPLKKPNYSKRISDLGSRLRGNDVVGGDGSSGRMAMIAEVSITIGLDSAAVFHSRGPPVVASGLPAPAQAGGPRTHGANTPRPEHWRVDVSSGVAGVACTTGRRRSLRAGSSGQARGSHRGWRRLPLLPRMLICAARPRSCSSPGADRPSCKGSRTSLQSSPRREQCGIRGGGQRHAAISVARMTCAEGEDFCCGACDQGRRFHVGGPLR